MKAWGERIGGLLTDLAEGNRLQRAFVGGLLATSLFGLTISAFGFHKAFATAEQTERESSVSVMNYQQEGAFDYTVSLKPNEVFETTQLDPGRVYFTNLVEDIHVTFSYKFSSSSPWEEAAFTYQAIGTFGSPDMWEKEITLIPTGKSTQEEFSFSFDLSIHQFPELAETFREETGVTLESPQLTIQVQVTPEVQTRYGSITEPFEQSLTFSFEEATIRGGNQLETSQRDSITKTRQDSVSGLSREQASWLKIGSGLIATVSIYLLGSLVRMSLQFRPRRPEQQRELQQVRKKLQGLFVQVDELPPVQESQIVVQLSSLEELLDLAEEMFRPVICNANEDGFSCCMIDGLSAMRYEYTNRRQGVGKRDANDESLD